MDEYHTICDSFGVNIAKPPVWAPSLHGSSRSFQSRFAINPLIMSTGKMCFMHSRVEQFRLDRTGRYVVKYDLI
jgi:hypothetical protein